MDDFELQLRRALAPEDPPPGFADRVLRQAKGGRRAFPRWVLAAAACLALFGAGYEYRWQQGQAAKRQTLLALRLTSSKLRHIQAAVQPAPNPRKRI